MKSLPSVGIRYKHTRALRGDVSVTRRLRGARTCVPPSRGRRSPDGRFAMDTPVTETMEQPKMSELLFYFLRLGTTGFGGPIALVGYMQHDLVEKRGWISRQDYVEGLALAQLAPGPLAAQLAIYLGWVRGGVTGA